MPGETGVAFRGVVNMDGAGGGTAQMLYPAPNVAGLVAAVITHGILSGITRQRESTRLQEAADRVLDPYRSFTDSMRHEQLLQLAIENQWIAPSATIAGAGAAPADSWLFAVDPVFSMTQDRHALILDAAVVVYAPNAHEKPVYQNAVRVVSAPVAGDEPALHWSADDGRQLRGTAAQLFAIALELVSSDLSHSSSPPAGAASGSGLQRTIRYLEGRSERFERSELLRVNCDRAVLRTLRGGLLAVPLKVPHAYRIGDAPNPGC